jgi:predicted nucleic-acid-binding protein
VLGLDTNVLVRYLVRDEPAAFRVVCDLIKRAVREGDSIMICSSVLLETEWVLRSSYKIRKAQIIALFNLLLERPDISFEDEPIFEIALQSWKYAAVDFADCMIVAKYFRLGCDRVATFDKKAGKLPGTLVLPTQANG